MKNIWVFERKKERKKERWWWGRKMHLIVLNLCRLFECCLLHTQSSFPMKSSASFVFLSQSTTVFLFFSQEPPKPRLKLLFYWFYFLFFVFSIYFLQTKLKIYTLFSNLKINEMVLIRCTHIMTLFRFFLFEFIFYFHSEFLLSLSQKI